VSNKDDFARRLARLQDSANQDPQIAAVRPVQTRAPRRGAAIGLGLAFGFAGMGAMIYVTLGHAPQELVQSPKRFLETGIRARMSDDEIRRMEADPTLDLELLRQQGHSNPDLARLLLSN